jgi:hypothetical protein
MAAPAAAVNEVEDAKLANERLERALNPAFIGTLSVLREWSLRRIFLCFVYCMAIFCALPIHICNAWYGDPKDVCLPDRNRATCFFCSLALIVSMYLAVSVILTVIRLAKRLPR